MSPEEVSSKSREIYNKITASDYFKNARNIMIYISFSNEVNTFDLIKEALSQRKNVLVPVTVGEDIKVCVLEDTTSLIKGAFGIYEPAEKKEWQGDIDLCIIPGLGFDRSGGRLGFGRGYYDRFLSENPCKKIGIAYENQIEDNVFSEAHDIPMDIIVTEREFFCCGKGD